MAWFCRLRNRAAELRRIEIPRERSARIIGAILVELNPRKESESEEPSGLHYENECGAGGDNVSRISEDEH
jgi:hypothetical protein